MITRKEAQGLVNKYNETIKAQREKNQVLKDISNKLDNLNYLKKEA